MKVTIAKAIACVLLVLGIWGLSIPAVFAQTPDLTLKEICNKLEGEFVASDPRLSVCFLEKRPDNSQPFDQNYGPWPAEKYWDDACFVERGRPIAKNNFLGCSTF